MTNKTHAELIAVARSAALAQPESNPADCAVDAVLDEIGYEPAPEPGRGLVEAWRSEANERTKEADDE